MDKLPLDIHIRIARYLPLRDALSYLQVCTITFDAVYYVFSHRRELDFSSVLHPNNYTIALSDDTLLNVLHAHTRATVISNFSLSATFNMYPALERYFLLYWRECTNMFGAEVGHPLGQLERISYLNYRGLAYNASNENKARLNQLWHKLEPYDEYLSCIESQFCSTMVDGVPWYRNYSLYDNWSTVDLDNP